MLSHSSLSIETEASYRELAAKLQSVRSICRLLKLDVHELEEQLSKFRYREFSIPKRHGGQRTILAPYQPLKGFQQKLAQALTAFYRQYMKEQESVQVGLVGWGNLEPPYGGFTINSIKGNSPVLSNAKSHCGYNYLLKLDVKDFYSSIPNDEVLTALRWKLGMDEEAAYLLLLLCTRNGRLPTGAPTSPILSELVMFDFDYLVSIWLKQRDGYSYTRYADDISISSEHEIDVDFVVGFVGDQLAEYGLQLNSEKTIHLKPHQARYVTGVKVNEKPNVDRKYIRELRAILHHWERFGVYIAARKYLEKYPPQRMNFYFSKTQYFRFSLKGKIEWVGQVRGKEDNIYGSMKHSFKELTSLNM